MPRCEPADVDVDEGTLQAVARYVESGIERGTFPGGLVMATRGRRLFYAEAWGETAAPDGSMRQLSLDLRQPFFSFSKGIATTVACGVHARGLLDWDAEVEHYVPGYGGKGKQGTLLRHTVSHALGIPSSFPFLPDDRHWAEALDELRQAPAELPPGSGSPYHPISGHLLAGAICSNVTGASFAELSRELLDAIGATSTNLRPPGPTDDDVAVVPRPGHEGPGGALVAWQPGAGYVGRPEDILRVLHLHLDQGADVIPWASLVEMHTPQFAAEIEAGNPAFHGWALGWMLGYRADRISASGWLGFGPHTRSNTFSHAGFSSLLGMGDPDRDVAIAVCLADAPADSNGPSVELATEARVTIANTVLAACRE
jgi:CubicO group peptidase (beta-lactamase class C family)